MFDVGFWELVLVGVVALVVVGPERLPELARTAGRWVGAARRMAASFRTDLEREVRAEELKKMLAKQSEFRGAFEIVEQTKQDLQGAVSQLNSPLDEPTVTVAPPAPTPPTAPLPPTADASTAPTTPTTGGADLPAPPPAHGPEGSTRA